MGGGKGAWARSRLTLTCIFEVNASGRDVVQVDWVMEQDDPWAFVGKACALFLLSDGDSLCKHACVVNSLDGWHVAKGMTLTGFQI